MQFNSKSFLRQVSNPTLARFFSRYPTFSEFDWQTLKEHQVEPIFETWNTLPDDERREATRISRQAHALASVRGTRALIEAGRERNLDLTEKLKPFKSGHERALTCFLDQTLGAADDRLSAEQADYRRRGVGRPGGSPRHRRPD